MRYGVRAAAEPALALDEQVSAVSALIANTAAFAAIALLVGILIADVIESRRAAARNARASSALRVN